MSHPVRVLSVEDSEDDSLLLLRELRRGGYEPAHQRVDTREAMSRALEERPWDIILSDHSMPRFDCFAALALLQQSGLDLPFIIVSGAVGEETAVRAMKAGAHDYVPKTNLSRLNATIEREMRQMQVRRARRHAEYEERRLHRVLEVQHVELERRVRELTSLNKLFHEHLRERFAVVEAYRQSVRGLQYLAEQAAALAKEARSRPMPDLSDVPGIDA